MTTKVLIRSVVIAALGLAIVVPMVAYGRDTGGIRTGRIAAPALVALDTGFTFQGRLTDAGAPANGVYDLNFFLYDSLAGGSQVGPAQPIGDVTVTAGLFTVTLNFGDVFHGAQYFLDIQVRPGASSGAYTVLSPREPIGAVPNASYAVNAGRLDLPSASSGSADGTLLTITNASTAASAVAVVGESASSGGSAAGVVGRITSAAAGNSAGVRGINDSTGGPAPGVFGSNAGSGYGVYGTSPSGVGVYGVSNSGTGGTFSSATGTALDVSGPLKVSGATPAAFVHTASAPTGQSTVIDNPATNNNPTAIVIVTQRWEGVYNPHPVGVWYSAGKWLIFNEDVAAMPVNAQFNVLVINR
ncbi:MAG: hypothetical protein HYX53_10790 [Chloroflexi bacterium]|nr:hypothetical protein [Chloroflexota bacterium]